MKLIVKEIIADEPTVNGRIYTRQELENMIQEYMKDTQYNYGILNCDMNIELRPEEIAFRVLDMKLVDNKIEVDIKILDTPNGQILTSMIELNKEFIIQDIVPSDYFLQLRLFMSGNVDENNHVNNVKLIYPYISTKEDK